jgi:hypothetical protein
VSPRLEGVECCPVMERFSVGGDSLAQELARAPGPAASVEDEGAALGGGQGLRSTATSCWHDGVGVARNKAEAGAETESGNGSEEAIVEEDSPLCPRVNGYALAHVGWW